MPSLRNSLGADIVISQEEYKIFKNLVRVAGKYDNKLEGERAKLEAAWDAADDITRLVDRMLKKETG